MRAINNCEKLSQGLEAALDVMDEDDGILERGAPVGSDIGAEELAAEQGREASEIDGHLKIFPQQGDGAIAIQPKVLAGREVRAMRLRAHGRLRG